MRNLLVLLLSLFLLFSCSTFMSTEGPEWTRTTPTHSGYVVFVGNGTGSDERSARADAYMNLLEQVGYELGYDAVSPYYRQLLSTDAIAPLEAVITNTYSSPINDGTSYYAMLEIPESIYYSSRSEEYSASIERTGRIGELLDSALESYRENHDTEALIDVLNALDLSLSGPVMNDSYAPQLILEQAVEYLRNIEITVMRGGRGTDVSIRMRRSKGFMHPAIVGGLAEAGYTMVNGDGEAIDSFVTLMTDEDGTARFFRTNPYMLWDGTISFSVYIPEDLIASIESKAPEGFLSPLFSLLDDSTVYYSYDEDYLLPPSDTVIAVAEYGEDGVQLGLSAALNSFSSYLEKASVSGYAIVPGEGEEELEVLGNLQSDYPGLDNYILLRVGIVDSESGGGVEYVLAEAQLSFYRNGESEPHTVKQLVVSGGGEDEETAGEAALVRAGSAAAGMFLSEL